MSGPLHVQHLFCLAISLEISRLCQASLGLGSAIPDGPVISALGIAIIFRDIKGLYRELSPLWYKEVEIPWMELHDQLYQEFLWGMSEYPEMLVALSLLVYAS